MKKSSHLLLLLLCTAFAFCHAEEDILAYNLLRNGDFEQGLEGFVASVQTDAACTLSAPGFESARLLNIKVPEGLGTTENFVSQTLAAPMPPQCRSYRVTYWMRDRAFSATAGCGAGLRFVFLDAEGKEVSRLYNVIRRNTKGETDKAVLEKFGKRGWENWESTFTLPEGVTQFRIDAGLFAAWGEADIDRVIVYRRPLPEELLAASSPVDMTVTDNIVKPSLSELHFIDNADFVYDGFWRGTLPANHPQALRRPFADALHAAGVRVLRFPGGVRARTYFIEGERFQQQLRERLPSTYVQKPYGGYAEIGDVMDFCRENGFKLLFQTNTLFYVDRTGQVRPVAPSTYSRLFSAEEEPPHYDEAALALEAFVKQVQPDIVPYWEIGNEDFAIMNVEAYAQICKAYIDVIKRHIPDAVIYVTGNEWTAALARRLEELDVLKDVDAFTVHYPWGDHWRSEGGRQTDYRRLVCATLNWQTNAKAHRRLLDSVGATRVGLSASETNVFKIHNWSAKRLVTTPCHGLLFITSWIEAIYVKDWNSLAFHDLCSPFFGMLFCDYYFDKDIGAYAYLTPDGQVPEERQAGLIIKDAYKLTPAARMQGLLSRHVGQDVLQVTPSGDAEAQLHGLLINALATRGQGGTVSVTVVNRGERARLLRLELPNEVSSASAKGLRYEGLEGDFADGIAVSPPVACNGCRLEVTLPPFSVIQVNCPQRTQDTAEPKEPF